MKETYSVKAFSPTALFQTEEAMQKLALEALGHQIDPNKVLQFFHLPICFIESEGVIQREATLFLAHVSINSRSHHGDTVLTYAKNLLPWLRRLSSKAVDLTQVTEEHFAAFRTQLVRATSLSTSTTNLRIQVASYFHMWGQETARFPSQFGKFLVDRQNHDVIDWRRRLGPAVEHRYPRYIGLDDWLKIREISSNPWRLMFCWAICTGLRRWEICNLRLGDLEGLLKSISPNDVAVRFSPVRKGGRRRPAFVPPELVRATKWWADTERPPRGKTAASAYLFVGGRGGPIDRNYLSRAFRAVADRAGSRATLHHLRHAFAMQVLDWLPEVTNGRGGTNALKIVQELLGHANQETSEVYLRASRGYEEAVISVMGKALFQPESK